MTNKQIEQIKKLFNFKSSNHCEAYPAADGNSCLFLGPSYGDLVWIDIASNNNNNFDVKWLYRGNQSHFKQKCLKFSDVKKIVNGYK
jgi:hypothetical protein